MKVIPELDSMESVCLSHIISFQFAFDRTIHFGLFKCKSVGKSLCLMKIIILQKRQMRGSDDINHWVIVAHIIYKVKDEILIGNEWVKRQQNEFYYKSQWEYVD